MKGEKEMQFDKWFKKQSKLIRVLLLIIPGLNYFIEIFLRASICMRTKSIISIIFAVIAIIPSGIALGIIDAICTILFDSVLLEE